MSRLLSIITAFAYSLSAHALLFSGGFIQPWLAGSWAPPQFAAEFASYSAVCLNHFIWQWTVDSTPAKRCAFYPSALPGIMRCATGSPDPVLASLDAAAAANLTIWLGLSFNSDWWTHYANDPVWLTNETELAVSVAAELWQLYGGAHASAIAGFYLPLEVDNVNFASPLLQARMVAAYTRVVGAIHSATTKPVMAAPFFNPAEGLAAAEYAAWWASVAGASELDVLALQDGVGVGHATVAQLPAWFEALQGALEGTKCALWSDLETFAPGPVPAPMERMGAQLAAVAPFVDRVTTFAFSHYQSPQQGFEQQFAAWQAFARSAGCKKA